MLYPDGQVAHRGDKVRLWRARLERSFAHSIPTSSRMNIRDTNGIIYEEAC